MEKNGGSKTKEVAAIQKNDREKIIALAKNTNKYNDHKK